MIRFELGTAFPLQQLLSLYEALGWLQHRYPERVARALSASSRVVTAWDGDRLVGMARMITDGEFCLYVPEILLYPQYQGKGHGRELMSRLLEGYDEVQNTVLLSDSGNDEFYRRFRFETVDGSKGFQAMWRMGTTWGK